MKGTFAFGTLMIVGAALWLTALVASGFSLPAFCPGLLALLFVTGDDR